MNLIGSTIVRRRAQTGAPESVSLIAVTRFVQGQQLMCDRDEV